MGLLLLKTNDCNLIYEFNKGTTLQVKVMKSKKRPREAVIQPLKVVLGGTRVHYNNTYIQKKGEL